MLFNILIGISAIFLALILVCFALASCLWIASGVKHKQGHEQDKAWPRFKEDKDE